MISYQSTRGQAGITPMEAILAGIAPDGGLLIPDTIPSLPIGGWMRSGFRHIAATILNAWLPGFDAAEVADHAYAAFDTPEVVPLRAVGDRHVLELFHGPTLAFKDIALCVLPRLMQQSAALLRPHARLMVLIATSGDTGSAAMHGFRDLDGIGALAFYPQGGVSAVQRSQMVTMPGRHISACGIRGSFDDAQRGVKDIFLRAAEAPFPGGVALTSANSINIGRLVPQIAYYYSAYAALVVRGQVTSGDPVDFSVPTGNFGDIMAGWLAKAMGLPVGRLICATNANDALHRFLTTGVYDRRRPLVKTLSPSMDILVSSNLERLLWYACAGDSGYVRTLMTALARDGIYQVQEDVRSRIAEDFVSTAVDDRKALATIAQVYRLFGYAIDPHTAAAWAAADGLSQPGRPCVVLATASPFKFPQAMAEALHIPGVQDTVDAAERLAQALGTPVPEALKDLRARPELYRDIIDPDEMAAYVRKAVTL